MSMDWTIEYEGSSGAWLNDGNFPRPNQDLETEYISTQQKIKMADGRYGFVTPEIKRLRESFTMFFANTTSAFRSQIETYMYNGDKIRLTTHTSEVYIGRFISIKRVWFSGIDNEYDISVVFECTE